RLGGAIDRHGAVADQQLDPRRAIGIGLRHRQLRRALTGEDRGQVYAIVGGARLLAKGGDAPAALWVGFDHQFDRPMTDHAVADHHQSLRVTHVSSYKRETISAT